MSRIKQIIYGRQATSFIKQMIENGDIEITPRTGTIELPNGFQGQVDSYDIYSKHGDYLAIAPKWFGDQDITVVSLVQEEGLFFQNFLLEINHMEFAIPNRKAHWLYDRVESAKKQSSPKPVKSM